MPKFLRLLIFLHRYKITSTKSIRMQHFIIIVEYLGVNVLRQADENEDFYKGSFGAMEL